MIDLKRLPDRPEYAFLREHPRLGSRIMLLGVSGSHGYGTNREGSDIDLRGVTMNMPSDLIGLTSFEQFEDRSTDTVIFSFRKAVSLFLNCNPNMIEILGLDEDQYMIISPAGRELLDNRHLFLTKRAAASFGHYADAQLRRLQNAIARDSLSQPSREEHIFRSVSHALEDFNRKNREQEGGISRLYIDDAVTDGTCLVCRCAFVSDVLYGSTCPDVRPASTKIGAWDAGGDGSSDCCRHRHAASKWSDESLASKNGFQ